MAQSFSNSRSALGRVLRQAGGGDVLGALSALSGADPTTLQLELMRRRAAGVYPAGVLERYCEDRFVAPGPVPFGPLRRAEDTLLSALPASFDLVTLSPVTPLGTHSALATVDQNKVVSTIRGSEVAADPTNALALEAAVRRRSALAADSRSASCIRLAAVQRVVRAQQVDGAASFAHFSLVGVVSAGRDTGSLAFERQHIVEHLGAGIDAMRAAGAGCSQLRLTVLDPRFEAVVQAARESLSSATSEIVDDPDREDGRGYYEGMCIKLLATFGDQTLELGDGGFVDWTRKLLSNRKERLLISGIGVDRLALVSPG